MIIMGRRKAFDRILSLGLIVACALMLHYMWIWAAGCHVPFGVSLSESMEPGITRGDMTFLYNSSDPIRAGDIVVFKIEGAKRPISHRVIKVHERRDTGEQYILTKGDNNEVDDTSLYAPSQRWIQRQHIIGKVVGIVPYIAWPFVLEFSWIMNILVGAIILLILFKDNQ